MIHSNRPEMSEDKSVKWGGWGDLAAQESGESLAVRQVNANEIKMRGQANQG